MIEAQKNNRYLGKIRIVFQSNIPLSRQFNRRNPRNCQNNCKTCQTACFPNQCQTKNAVYKISCNICNKEYIGQTKRILRTRILEHCTSSDSHVKRHFVDEHKEVKPTNFKWKILKTIKNKNARQSAEAHLMKISNNLMNGCEGIKIMNL